MKKLTLPRLKSLAPQPKKRVQKLAANAAHRLTPPAFDDYDEEPTTKLSTAFVVVLILHLVAVGGIYAFHSIKVHRKGAEAASTEITKAVAAAPAALQHAPVPLQSGLVKPVAAPVVQAKVGSQGIATAPTPAQTTAGKSTAVKVESAPPVAKVVASAAPVLGSVSGGGPHVDATGANPPAAVKTYTVVKGDNPVVIAKRLGVTEDELLKLNGISDPKKLQIGQVLKVPAKKGAN